MPKRVKKEISAEQAYRSKFARLGGLKGGPARKAALSAEQRTAIARKAGQSRAAKMTPEERSALARKSAAARWNKTPQA